MGITFSGLATGLDTDSIVKEIMALERAPLDRIEKQKEAEAERLKAFKQFSEKLADLKSAVGDMSLTSQIRKSSVSLSNEGNITATTNGSALGTYSIAVAQLAQQQKTTTNGFSSMTESVLGTGTLNVNGTEIVVDESNNSLSGILEAINAVSGDTGVSASIINDGSTADNYHLVFTGKDSSTSFTVDSTLVAEDSTEIQLNPTNVTEAQQAVAFIDGIKVVSDSNTISSAINGVSIDLDAVSSMSYAGTEEAGVPSWEWADPPQYQTTTMTISADTESLKEKLTAFVTAYNGIVEWINDGYEEFGGSSQIVKTGDDDREEAVLSPLLRGDSTVYNIKRQLQSALSDVVNNSGKFGILSEIGIVTNKNGTLTQNNTKIDAALEKNYDDMVYLLSGDDLQPGAMKKFNSLLLDMTSGTKGMYATQKNAYQNAIGKFDSQIDQIKLRLAKRETTLRNQFNAMEQLVSSLNAQGDFLTQQLNAMNGVKKS